MKNNWKKYKLTDLGTLARGKSKNRPRDAAFLYGGKYPFIQTGDIKGSNHRIYSYTQTYSEAGLQQSKLWPKDTICVTIAANIGDTAILNFPACFPDSVLGFVADKTKCDVDFIEYLLQYYKREIQSHSIGSVQDNINLGTFEKVEFNLPPLPEQQAIAEILSSLDDKIELNLQTNKTLEDMANALYKHWFVDFGPFKECKFVESELGMIPKDFKVVNFKDVCYNHSKTFNFKGKEKVIFVNTGDILEGKFLHKNYSDIDGLPGQAKKIIELNDILFSEIRPGNKRYALINFDVSDYVVSTKFMVIRANENILPRILYRILRDEKIIKEFQSIAESRSGTFPQITFDAISDIKFPMSNIETQNAFMERVLPLENKIENNNIEIEILKQTRDYLLPKLISGEIRVTEAANSVKQLI
jgi:type I restriction enzyme S subunit